MTPRGTSSRLWQRTVDLILCASQHRYSRAQLAERWRTSPRTVSNVLAHARETYDVEIDTGLPQEGSPYRLRSAGVLSLPALQTRMGRR
jgi:chromosome segregation and condensation protein ScpB